MTALTVVATGPLATVQDLGRPGYADVGVGRSGGADRASLRLANRLVGNDEAAATIESTYGGLLIRADSDVLVAVTGAASEVLVDDRPVGADAALAVRAGQHLRISPPTWGCRNYVAVRGGIDVAPVLGSRSTDTLSGLGPAALRAGDRLPVGVARTPWPATTVAPGDSVHPDVTDLPCGIGPRADLLADPALLFAGRWEVGPDSDRIGVRVHRPSDDLPSLGRREDAGEPASEGIAHGSVQVPPRGHPVIFLADHPVTGGYPVVAVLTPEALDAAAQLTAGALVRFRRVD